MLSKVSATPAWCMMIGNLQAYLTTCQHHRGRQAVRPQFDQGFVRKTIYGLLDDHGIKTKLVCLIGHCKESVGVTNKENVGDIRKPFILFGRLTQLKLFCYSVLIQDCLGIVNRTLIFVRWTGGHLLRSIIPEHIGKDESKHARRVEQLS